jgi:hypothetical protein
MTSTDTTKVIKHVFSVLDRHHTYPHLAESAILKSVRLIQDKNAPRHVRGHEAGDFIAAMIKARRDDHEMVSLHVQLSLLVRNIYTEPCHDNK